MTHQTAGGSPPTLTPYCWFVAFYWAPQPGSPLSPGFSSSCFETSTPWFDIVAMNADLKRKTGAGYVSIQSFVQISREMFHAYGAAAKADRAGYEHFKEFESPQGHRPPGQCAPPIHSFLADEVVCACGSRTRNEAGVMHPVAAAQDPGAKPPDEVLPSNVVALNARKKE